MHEDSTLIPRFAPGVALRFNAVRQQHILLAPERVFVPDGPALAILQRINGARSVGAMIASLAEVYDASPDQIGPDVWAALHQLARRGAIVWNEPEKISQAPSAP